jgi:hypothetical protein
VSDIYRIDMDGRWQLRDLYEFPHAFMQAYAFVYCFDSDAVPRSAERIDYALESYPWAGGYSIVNIYAVLQHQIPSHDRPSIASIRYASPGWIDLLLSLHPAVKIAASVATIAASVAGTAKSYAALQKVLYDISLQKRRAKLEEIQLTRAQLEELDGLTQDLAKYVGFNGYHDLNLRTGRPVVTAKKKANLPSKRRDDG